MRAARFVVVALMLCVVAFAASQSDARRDAKEWERLNAANPVVTDAHAAAARPTTLPASLDPSGE
jgi:hypothetical protein